MARLEAGKTKTVRAAVDLCSVVSSVTDLTVGFTVEVGPGADLSTTTPPGGPSLSNLHFSQKLPEH